VFVRMSSSAAAGAGAGAGGKIGLWHHDPALLNSRGLAGGAARGRGKGRGGRGSGGETEALLASANKAAIGAVVNAGRGSDWATERGASRLLFHLLKAELERHEEDLAGGLFSLAVHGSGFGVLPALIGAHFKNSTVLAIEPDSAKSAAASSMLAELGIANVYALSPRAELDHAGIVVKNLADSPELLHFQVVSRSVLDLLAQAASVEEWGAMAGDLLSVALTTFVNVPPAAQVSLAFRLVFGPPPRHPSLSLPSLGGGGGDGDGGAFSIASHPTKAFRGFESLLLLGHAHTSAGFTAVDIEPIRYEEPSRDNRGNAVLLESPLTPLVRCDVRNASRPVHHHFESSKDGHTRTYTLVVAVNESLTLSTLPSLRGAQPLLQPLPAGCHHAHRRVTCVTLYRDKDGWRIPYEKVHGVTLIAALRLGLERRQRDRLFSGFLHLPLYEDMAPWNMVLLGEGLGYIDFDTRSVTFDKSLSQVYALMTVLMNYKRTVADFEKCGGKAATVYSLPFVSDCVGRSSSRSSSGSSSGGAPTCTDVALPVPCTDGRCHGDFISCLRSLSDAAEALAGNASAVHVAELSLKDALLAAIREGHGRFDKLGPAQE